MLDYKLLESLYSVIDEGGFEKASEKLCITQSAVSQRIKLLEEQTGKILLLRSTPPRPTRSGLKYYNHYLKVRYLEEDLDKKDEEIRSLPLAINEDSLATWFLPAITPLLNENRLLHLYIDDQEKTIELLKNGEVIGSISSWDKPLSGCRMIKIGEMNYNLLSTREFKDSWFKDGLTEENFKKAPAVIFNVKDRLHEKQVMKLFNKNITFPHHIIPSSEKFYDFLQEGKAYGLIPDILRTRDDNLIELTPGENQRVSLYLHIWDLIPEWTSDLLKHFINDIRDLIY